MNHLLKETRLFAILVLILFLAGCNTPTVVVPPTPDIPRIRTESAQTVVAKLTIEAALNPTVTTAVTQAPAVVTATTAPSPTQPPAGQETATLIPTITLAPTLRPTTSGVIYPTATRRAGPDQAQYITQSPSDGKVFHAGEEFDAVWTFKNVGTSTWNSHFYYRFAKRGVNLAKTDRYYLKEDVAPGEQVSLVADMVAPAEAGRYVSYWELVNDNGAVFYGFYVVIDVK